MGGFVMANVFSLLSKRWRSLQKQRTLSRIQLAATLPRMPSGIHAWRNYMLRYRTFPQHPAVYPAGAAFKHTNLRRDA